MPSYHDYYAASPYARYLREHRLAGAAGGMIEAAQPAGDFSDPPVADLVLIRVVSDGIRQRSDLGGGRFTERSPAGTLFLVAPETATDIVVDGPHVIRCLALPAATTRPILEPLRPGGDPFDFGRLHRGGFDDPLVLALMDRLWAEAEHGDAAGRLFAEGAVATILAALARDAGGPAEPERGRLADWQVRRTTDHMMDRLGEEVSLAEIAAVAGLSPSHFCRAFRRSTGLPPHRWLTRRRVERACELLRGTQGRRGRHRLRLRLRLLAAHGHRVPPHDRRHAHRGPPRRRPAGAGRPAGAVRARPQERTRPGSPVNAPGPGTP